MPRQQLVQLGDPMTAIPCSRSASREPTLQIDAVTVRCGAFASRRMHNAMTGRETMQLNEQGLKSFWRSRVLRRADFADKHKRLDALYRVKDPWGFTDPREEMRFHETNRILLREFGQIGTLLEIGCAEGHQTAYLMRVCHQLHGLDVSRRAVRRAKLKCPRAILGAGDIASPARIAGSPE